MYGGCGQKKYGTAGPSRESHETPVGFIERPDTVVKKAEALLVGQAWEEVIVGLGVLSGRCLVEVLKTGVIMPKTRYSLLFTAYQEQTDQVLGPFELPTLVEAQTVLEVWQCVRTQMECENLETQEIGARYRDLVTVCAKKHFARSIPVSDRMDWYAPLYQEIYPLIAMRYYCPPGQDPMLFQALVRGLKWPSTGSKAYSCCSDCQRPCGVYHVGDGVKQIDGHCGLKLDQEGVEILECLRLQGVCVDQEGSGDQARSYAAPSVLCEGVVATVDGLDGEGSHQEDALKCLKEAACGQTNLVSVTRALDGYDPEVEGLEVFQQESGLLIQEAVAGEPMVPAMLDPREGEQGQHDGEEGGRDAEPAEEKRVQAAFWGGRNAEKTIPMEMSQEVTSLRKAQKKRGKAKAREWLRQRWKWFVFEMAQWATETDEEVMRARCEGELTAWRAYSEEFKSLSFQEMVMAARIALHTSIPAPQNEWWNPETEEWEHIGLKYLTCTAAEWEQMKQVWLARRLLLPDPEQIISRAIGMLSTGLMDAEAWPQLVVGIAVLTGQGLLRILKNGRFSQKTAFSLLFRDEVHYNSFFRDPFELPTLGRADLVVEAWKCVRERVDCRLVDEQELQHHYGQLVSETATTFFRDLVPLPGGETDLFFMLSSCVYPCLATHYYCPPSLEIVEYLAQICHDPVLLADPSPGERFACAAVCNYLEYRLADERKGIWLDQVRKAELCADYAVVEMEFDEEEIEDLDAIRQQMGFDGRATMMDRDSEDGNVDPEDVAGTLKLSITLQNQGLSPAMYEFLHCGLEHLMSGMAEFVSVCLREEMLKGLKLQQPFETMESSELMVCDHPEATYELSRRAIITVMRYNQSISNPAQRWYINEDMLFHLLQKSRSDIRWCLHDHQQEIKQHHQRYHLAAAGNVKRVPVTVVIQLAEEPYWFGKDRF